MLLFSRDLGGAGRPPLVILHGMLGSSRNWQTAGRDLAATFHFFALDLRNHGSSPHAAEMTYTAMVTDVIAWLDAQRLGRVTLLGHSMGGKVAMLLACRHPERVTGLIVVDIAPKGYFWPAHREEFAGLNELDLAHLASRAAADKQLETRISHWGMRKFLLTNLEQTPTGSWRWSINLPALTAALEAMEANPLAPTDRFAGAALFIAGDRSPYVGPGDHAAIRETFPSARIVTLPSGHNPHTEAREAFVALVASTAQ
jgi:pimeloyl-ACP methyl ester carboxylesterase